MDASENIARLRRQRNLLGVAAVVIVIAGMAVSLPRALDRRKQLKATNTELLQLQSDLISIQQQIGKIQTDIRGVQDQIHTLVSVRR